MANYSLVCWGGPEFNANNRLVFARILPGPCLPMSSCQCGVLPGSTNLCDDGRCVCVDCVFELNVARPNASLIPVKGDRSRRTMWIAIVAGAAAFLVFFVALQFALVLWCCRRRRHRRNEQDTSGGAQQSLMPPRVGSSRSRGPGRVVVENFTLDMLHASTDGFSDDSRIGTGSFGSVYRGTLLDGREVAIKRVEDSDQARWRGTATERRRSTRS
jgi:hypothetical protein